MSTVLNAMDGVMPAFGVIRFFSANDPNVIASNEALASRFHRLLYFDKPKFGQIKEQIKRVYKNSRIDSILLGIFSGTVDKYNLNMRQITDFLCRFLDEEDPLKEAVNNLESWIDEINKFNDYKTLVCQTVKK
jgi:SpoVK/Ycf46/Vps4 family AAA+-type ATPase